MLPEIISDYNRVVLNATPARLVLSAFVLGVVLHVPGLIELGVICIPMAFQLKVPSWTKTMIWSFFLPAVFMTLAMAIYSRADTNLLEVVLKVALPVGLVCMAIVSFWLGIASLSVRLVNALRGGVKQNETAMYASLPRIKQN